MRLLLLIPVLAAGSAQNAPEVRAAPAEAGIGDAPASAIQVAPSPDRFVAYLFDDVHMSLGDLVHTREAAKRRIDSLNLSLQRVGYSPPPETRCSGSRPIATGFTQR